MFKWLDKIKDKSINLFIKVFILFLLFIWFYTYFLEKFEPKIWGGFWIFALAWLFLYFIIRYIDKIHYFYCLKNNFHSERWDYKPKTKVILSSFLLIMAGLSVYEIINNNNNLHFSDFINKDFFISIIIIVICIIYYYIRDFFHKKGIIDFCTENNFTYLGKLESFEYFSGIDIVNVSNCFKPLKIDTYYIEYSAAFMREDKENNLKITMADCNVSYRKNPLSKNDSNFEYTVCEIVKKGMLFPVFTLRDEKFFFDTINSSIGKEEDIDFMNDKDFSDSFFLKGDFSNLVRRFFNDKVREAFKKYHIKGVSYLGKPKALFICCPGHLNLKQRKDFLLSILNIFNAINLNFTS